MIVIVLGMIMLLPLFRYLSSGYSTRSYYIVKEATKASLLLGGLSLLFGLAIISGVAYANLIADGNTRTIGCLEYRNATKIVSTHTYTYKKCSKPKQQIKANGGWLDIVEEEAK